MTPAKSGLATLLALALAACDRSPPPAPAPVAPPPAAPVEPAPPPVVLDIRVVKVERGKTLAATLYDAGLASDQVNEIIGALGGIFDFRKSRVGDQVRITRNVEGRVESLEYRASEIDEWLVERTEGKLVASKRAVEIEKRLETVDIKITSSMYEGMLASGEDPSLAVELADVFAWDIDFYRDVRSGDRLKAVVEKQYVRGRLLRYGPVLGAVYEGELVGSKRLLRYTTLAGETTYFDEKGQNAKKAFLKSPLKFVHITSRFGNRNHPILGYQQQHRGIDFAAAIGTPVWSVGDGTVVRAVRGDPGAGNFVAIRHTNGFETVYMHLSNFGDGVRVGARVRQKQVIAYSGNTGRSTGPHLHFELRRNGTHLNPLTQNFPRADPLPKAELPRFTEQTADVQTRLNSATIASADPL